MSHYLKSVSPTLVWEEFLKIESLHVTWMNSMLVRVLVFEQNVTTLPPRHPIHQALTTNFFIQEANTTDNQLLELSFCEKNHDHQTDASKFSQYIYYYSLTISGFGS